MATKTTSNTPDSLIAGFLGTLPKDASVAGPYPVKLSPGNGIMFSVPGSEEGRTVNVLVIEGEALGEHMTASAKGWNVFQNGAGATLPDGSTLQIMAYQSIPDVQRETAHTAWAKAHPDREKARQAKLAKRATK